jgi:alanine-glyoxylate transaminase/(R)-3-amino-2-methylpropionate-pyruvate transaminase
MLLRRCNKNSGSTRRAFFGALTSAEAHAHRAKMRTRRQTSTPTAEIVRCRETFLSPSLATFTAYDDPLVLARGEGARLYDGDGQCYIDLLGQNLCVSVGYGNATVIDAAKAQLDKLAHCTTMYYHEEPSLLAKELVAKMPPRPDGEDWVVHLVNDGSEAVDLAVQMARVHTGRSETISMHKAYHGLQGYAAGLTAIGVATQPCYAGMYSSGVHHVAPNDRTQLEQTIRFGTGGKVACFIAEPLQGYGGIFPLEEGYLRAAFETVRAAGGLTIADEVQTGYGRCGESFWGFEMAHNDAMPDLVTVAKGMGNGVGVIGAVIVKRSVAESFCTKMFFNTYGSNPVAAAAARAVLRVIDEEDMVAQCGARGRYMNKQVQELCRDFPSVYKEVRGTGLFQGLEVAGATAQEAKDLAYALHAQLRYDHQLIVGRGSAAGNVFRLQPPMCITEAEIDTVVHGLRSVAERYEREKAACLFGQDVL